MTLGTLFFAITLIYLIRTVLLTFLLELNICQFHEIRLSKLFQSLLYR